MKILILSIPEDLSTTNVLRWIYHLDSSVQVIRLHPDDLLFGKIILPVNTPCFILPNIFSAL